MNLVRFITRDPKIWLTEMNIIWAKFSLPTMPGCKFFQHKEKPLKGKQN